MSDTEVQKDLRMLSAYFMTSATKIPPPPCIITRPQAKPLNPTKKVDTNFCTLSQTDPDSYSTSLLQENTRSIRMEKKARWMLRVDKLHWEARRLKMYSMITLDAEEIKHALSAAATPSIYLDEENYGEKEDYNGAEEEKEYPEEPKPCWLSLLLRPVAFVTCVLITPTHKMQIAIHFRRLIRVCKKIFISSAVHGMRSWYKSCTIVGSINLSACRYNVFCTT